MKKILLLLATVLTSVGAWAQTPVVTLTGLEEQTYPYALPAEEQEKLTELEDMTIVMAINTGNLGNRKMLIGAADPTTVACTAATKDNSPYFGYGFNGTDVGYFASSLAGDRFTRASITANAMHYFAVTVNKTEGKIKVYVDGRVLIKSGSEILFENGAAGYQIQTFKKIFGEYPNAKIYVGGGKVKSGESEANYDTFLGKIYNLRIYNSALTNEQIADICDMSKLPVAGNFYRISYDYGGEDGVQYLQAVVSDVQKSGQNTPPVVYSKEKGASSVFYYSVDGLLSYSEGKYIKEHGNDRGLQAVGITQQTNIYPSKRDVNKFVVQAGSYLHANKTNGKFHSDHCSGNACNAHDHNVELVTELPVTISATGYATFFAPVAVTLPNGLEAYYVSEKTSEKATMVALDGVIPANTAVVLKGTAGEYNLTIGGNANAVSNLLEGTVADTYVAKNAYVLAQPEDNTVGFYLAEKNQSSGAAFLNNGFKAYLPVEAATARFLSFDFGGNETAIDELKGENGNVKTIIYDLSGRRVKAAQKGLYIVNGKVVIK